MQPVVGFLLREDVGIAALETNCYSTLATNLLRMRSCFYSYDKETG